ncbi:S-adenosyl methyltransferase [Nonomuraea solani]|uniref:S-adenosyl methyltransferase n=1 Tax=Nonomuraea solani TaxID=1144553 RepID=A0A1H5XU27_9ACTN|nr:SAM-dependent methyltransferase [Nonomuraea solani]SEG15231.1 S-adenosyl methyltransferase [Nonomuraea solani]
MTEPERPQGKIDPTVPTVARMYDYFLGGKDNFPADREVAERILELSSRGGADVREMARANRGFLVRAVETAARAGVRQFLDIGTGLPTQDNVHQVAHRIIPDAKVVYSDNDPIVLVHARALLADNPGTVILDGDAHDPKAILKAAAAHLDFSRPVAVLVVALFHFFADDDEVAAIVRALREPLAPGSHLIISHAYVEKDQSTVDRRIESEDIYRRTTSGALHPRDREIVRTYFDGLELLEPGLVPVQHWRNDDPFIAPGLDKGGILGGVGRVP